MPEATPKVVTGAPPYPLLARLGRLSLWPGKANWPGFPKQRRRRWCFPQIVSCEKAGKRRVELGRQYVGRKHCFS